MHSTPGLWNPEWTSHGPFFEKIKDRLVQPALPGGGGGPFAGGSSGAPGTTTFTGATPLGHPLAPILANWLDNHMFVASTLIGFTVMERFPAMKVVVAHGKASGREVLAVIKSDEKLRRIPVVVLTSSEAEQDVQSSYDLNANCYITKPVDFEQFIDVVRSIEDFWLRLVKLPRKD